MDNAAGVIARIRFDCSYVWIALIRCFENQTHEKRLLELRTIETSRTSKLRISYGKVR